MVLKVGFFNDLRPQMKKGVRLAGLEEVVERVRVVFKHEVHACECGGDGLLVW